MACSACGADLAADARFCSSCGASVATPRDTYTPTHLTDQILTSRFAREGERKHVTVLFADLVGSTALAERVGADAMHEVLDALFEVSLGAVHRRGGRVNQFLGDGFMSLFGAPIAHEDHARRAVGAALDIQRELAVLNLSIGGVRIRELPLRIGLNTGMVVVGAIGDNLRMDYTAIGDTTNLAARVMGLCPPGEVLASETTRHLCENDFDWEARGRQAVKGRSEPVSVFVATGNRRRDLEVELDAFAGTPFVGREGPIHALTESVASAAAGVGGIVSIVGEPGLGKSRLIAEVQRSVNGSERPPLWLEGRSLTFGESLGFWPFQDMLRRWAGVTEDDPLDFVVDRVVQVVTGACPDETADVLPYILVLLGLPVPAEYDDRVRFLDNQGSGTAVFRAVRLLVHQLARQGPVVMVFEDVHWADPASVELIEHLFPLVPECPLLIVGVARPEQRSPIAALREVAMRNYPEHFLEIRLAPLDQGASRGLMDELLVGPGAEALGRRIAERAEGNPFYAEEIVRSLASSGVVVREPGARHWRITGSTEDIAIPESVQAAITARIDRLDDEVKHVLKIASVIGRSFLYRVLEALENRELDLDGDLRALQLVELITERRRQPELEYAFTHALVQEAAYDSTLLDSRRRLHRQVAEAVEALFPDRLDEFAGILAHHYAAAAEWGRAHEYLIRAADNSGRMAADSVALAQYEQAITAYARAFGDTWDPVDRARLERKVADALFRMGRHSMAADHAREAFRLLGQRYPSAPAGFKRAILGQVLVQIGHLARPRWWRRRPSAERREVLVERCALADLLGWMDFGLDQERFVLDVLLSLNNAENSDDEAMTVQGLVGVGILLNVVGLKRFADRYQRRAAAIAGARDNPMMAGYVAMGRIFSLAHGGEIVAAIQASADCAEAYAPTGDLRRRSSGLAIGVLLARFRGDVALMAERSQLIQQLGDEGADSLLLAWGCQGLGHVASAEGPITMARQYLNQSLEIYREIPNVVGIAETLSDLAVCDLRSGDLESAVLKLDESDALIKANGLRGYSAAYPVLRHAEVSLLVAAQVGSAGRDAERKARTAVKGAVKYARTVPAARPWAALLQGRHEWARGKSRAAGASWQRALDLAKTLDTPYVEGLARLEIGRRNNQREELVRARDIFASLGMALDSTDAELALQELEERQ